MTGVATIRDSVISGNVVEAVSEAGVVNAAGGGIGSLSGRLTLERTVVTGNRGSGTGIGGLVLGGGILNVAFGGDPPQLTISDSVITANKLGATSAITPQGGASRAPAAVPPRRGGATQCSRPTIRTPTRSRSDPRVSHAARSALGFAE